MDTEKYVNTLLEHGIKPTANRIIVLRALQASMLPLSMSELERCINSIDKSNIFRAITLFHERHLVHAIEGSGDATRYEVCHSHHDDHDDDLHPHFYCETCQQTYCLEGVEVPDIPLPEGFEVHTRNYMIKGTCPHCKK